MAEASTNPWRERLRAIADAEQRRRDSAAADEQRRRDAVAIEEERQREALAAQEQRQREALAAQEQLSAARRQLCERLVQRQRDIAVERAESEREAVAQVPGARPPTLEASLDPFHLLLARVTACLLLGNLEEAQEAWESTHAPPPAKSLTEWTQMRELLGVARYLQPGLVAILAEGILRHALEGAYARVRAYAEPQPDRARYESKILRARAPHIARIVGDALIEDAAYGEDEPAKSTWSPLWIAALVIFGCVMVATIIVVTTPTRSGWRTEESSEPVPSTTPHVTTPRAPPSASDKHVGWAPRQLLDEPTEVREDETRTQSQRAIESSVFLLKHNGWLDAEHAFDGFVKAFADGDCVRVREMLATIDDAGAEELAKRHLEAIRTRVAGWCVPARKTFPRNSP